MRIADLDFILVPEWLAGNQPGAGDDDHWMSRWQRNIATANWLDRQDLAPPAGLLAQCAQSARPVVVITHGHAIDVLLSVTPEIAEKPVIGAFIVAPAPRQAAYNAGPGLTFPSLIVAPDDHPEFAPDAAQQLSQRLGSHYVAAGSAGRLDAASGQGPWPEGLMRLGGFLKRLSTH